MWSMFVADAVMACKRLNQYPFLVGYRKKLFVADMVWIRGCVIIHLLADIFVFVRFAFS